MRYIRTTNNQIEFIEANDSGSILNSIGLQLGEVYFQIKNRKVAFYLNDSEKPFDNFIWSMNLPITIDGETYDDEDEVSAVLHNIMNDRFQEQLDELREDLAEEIGRAQAAEEALGEEIDDERERAISAETHLQSEVTELSGLVSTFDERITDCEEAISALTDDLAAETAARISGDTYLEGLINTETTRAQGAESAITAALNAEISRSTAKDNLHDSLISALTESLQDEVARATSAETALDNKIDAEIIRSTNKDTEHDLLISGLTDDLSDEISRATAAENALDDKIDQEIADRASGDTRLENMISSETARAISAETNLHNEILAEASRATSAETSLHNEILAETSRATSAETVLHDEILAETTRALATENALVTALNNEITRSTSKDASHDALISGLTTSLQNEINRATGAENSLRNDLNSEISARTSSDNSQNQRLTALEVGKADANNVYTKAESDAKFVTKEYISGNTYTKDDVDALLAPKADKANAVASASYNSQNKTIELKNISGTVLSTIDATAFIKDGMVDTVVISGGNLVITFNTDAGKQPISIPLTDIFNPNNYYTKSEINTIVDNIESGITHDLSNYYTKSEVDASQLVQDNKINAISGDVASLSGKVDTISGKVETISGDVTNIVNSLSGDYATKEFVSGYTYDKATIDSKVASGGTFDPTNYYNKTETNALLNAKQNTLTAGSNISIVGSVISAVDTTYTAGSGISIVGNVISATGGGGTVDAYTKAESDAKYATITNFNSHSGNTSIHFTTGDVQNQIAAYTYDKNTIDQKTSGGTSLPLEEGTGLESIQHINGCKANAPYSFVGGDDSSALTDASASFAWGSALQTKNMLEVAFGSYNLSSRDLDGEFEIPSACTKFSIGDGSRSTGRRNSFEIRGNGDIYMMYNGGTVKLQDYLGNKTDLSAFTAHTADTSIHVTTAQTAAWDAKSNFSGDYNDLTNKLSAGTNVQINNNVISATDTTYTAGDGISISNQNVISATTKFWCGTQQQYDAISVKDPNTVYMIHD